MPLDLDGLYQEGFDAGKAEQMSEYEIHPDELAELRAEIERERAQSDRFEKMLDAATEENERLQSVERTAKVMAQAIVDMTMDRGRLRESLRDCLAYMTGEISGSHQRDGIVRQGQAVLGDVQQAPGVQAFTDGLVKSFRDEAHKAVEQAKAADVPVAGVQQEDKS